MHPCLILAIHIVLIDGVLGGEGALHLSDVVVDLLPPLLVHRGTERPDHAELEPQLDHAAVILTVCGVNLKEGMNG